MNPFDVTTPVLTGVATWIWRILLTEYLPRDEQITVRVFGETNAEGLESYLRERFSHASWYVYLYDANEPAIEFRTLSEKFRYEKCNKRNLADTIELYHPDQLSENARKLWRDWFKVYESSPYPMMLPNQETASLLPQWVDLARHHFESLIKDDWMDAFISSSELASSLTYHCQSEAAQAAMLGVLFLGRLTNQPERTLQEKITQARLLFSNIVSLNADIETQINKWVTNDYI